MPDFLKIYDIHQKMVFNLCLNYRQNTFAAPTQKRDFDALVVDLATCFPGPKGQKKIDNQ